MSVTQRILFTLSLLAWIMTYLTYSPSDARYFWTYWVSVFRFDAGKNDNGRVALQKMCCDVF
jgi:hypothetical protein